MATARTATRQLSREERRESILRAAAEAFASGGYSATSMDDVAAKAGVTKLILYRHFDSKEQLYREVLESVVDRLKQELMRRLGEGPARGAPIRSMLEVARENPYGFRLLMFHAVRERPFEELVWGYWNGAIRNLDLVIGGDRSPSPLRSWMIQAMWSYVIHSVLIWLDTGPPDQDEQFVELAAGGLAALYANWSSSPNLPSPNLPSPNWSAEKTL